MAGRQISTVEESSAPKRKVHILCEGETERQYFERFKNQPSTVPVIFKIHVEDKNTFERWITNRECIVKIADGHVQLDRRGRYTPCEYVITLLHDQWDSQWESIPKSEPFKKDVIKAIKKSIDEIEKNRDLVKNEDNTVFVKTISVDGSEQISDETADRIESIIKKHTIELEEDYQLNWDPDSSRPDRKHPDRKTWYDVDRVFIVFDRDKDPKYPEKRTDEEYRRVYKSCQTLDYEILLSTPFFEFWLLLHHDDVNAGAYSYETSLNSKNTILEDLSGREKKECTDWNVDRDSLDKVKMISDDRFNKFYNENGFATALKKSKELGSDFEGLLNHAGSNVGEKLDTLRSHESSPKM